MGAPLRRAGAQLDGSAPFSSAGTTEEVVDEFLTKLRKAVLVDDIKTVATLTAFPLRAWNGHHTIVVHDRREFAALYPTIFNAPLHKSIAAARVENSFANWQGVMWDNGRFWARSEDEGPLRIVAINAPGSDQ
jgi:hypothetical protein